MITSPSNEHNDAVATDLATVERQSRIHTAQLPLYQASHGGGKSESWGILYG
jgi:hypothetical protein